MQSPLFPRRRVLPIAPERRKQQLAFGLSAPVPNMLEDSIKSGMNIHVPHLCATSYEIMCCMCINCVETISVCGCGCECTKPLSAYLGHMVVRRTINTATVSLVTLEGNFEFLNSHTCN